MLDQIENGNMPSLEFIELNACSAGCVGGTMAVENPYIAKTRLQTLRRYLPVTQNWSYKEKNADTFVPEEYFSGDRLKYQPITLLDNDMDAAMRKMQAIEAINERLPHLDCGSCGLADLPRVRRGHRQRRSERKRMHRENARADPPFFGQRRARRKGA